MKNHIYPLLFVTFFLSSLSQQRSNLVNMIKKSSNTKPSVRSLESISLDTFLWGKKKTFNIDTSKTVGDLRKEIQKAYKAKHDQWEWPTKYYGINYQKTSADNSRLLTDDNQKLSDLGVSNKSKLNLEMLKESYFCTFAQQNPNTVRPNRWGNESVEWKDKVILDNFKENYSDNMTKEDKIRYHWTMCTDAMVWPEGKYGGRDMGKWWNADNASKNNTYANLIDPVYFERTHQEGRNLLPGGLLELKICEKNVNYCFFLFSFYMFFLFCGENMVDEAY